MISMAVYIAIYTYIAYVCIYIVYNQLIIRLQVRAVCTLLQYCFNTEKLMDGQAKIQRGFLGISEIPLLKPPHQICT